MYITYWCFVVKLLYCMLYCNAQSLSAALSRDGPQATDIIYQAEQLPHHFGAELSPKQLSRLQKASQQVKDSNKEVRTIVMENRFIFSKVMRELIHFNVNAVE